VINIGIGLPLSTADGGSGGVQGNWNGRIEALGGGGYAGAVGPVTGATDFGYVGSSTDTGHSAAQGGTFALNPDGTLNWGLIRDFAYNGIHAQAVWSKKLTQIYYGMAQQFTYWVGCSTGGRQGHQQAQRYPNDFDGILAGANAFNWDRFIPSEQWGEIAMNQEVGKPITATKLNAVSQAAIAACQNNFGGTPDGIVQDQRACLYDANAFVCGQPGVPPDPTMCLLPSEASAVNKIWNGPTQAGQQLWFGLERGAPLTGLNGTVPFSISTQWFQYWVFQDPNFDWHTLTESSFAPAFLSSELKFHQVIGTDDPDLSRFKNHGGKMITYHGLQDQLIFPRGTYNYYNRVTAAMGGLANTQSFYRFFPYPGNNHCGGNSNAPNAPLINGTDLFTALVNWVEHGTAPDSIVGFNNLNPALATVSRPICKYPDTLVYNGSGSIYSAANFHCQPQTTDPLMNAQAALPDPGAPANGMIATHDFNADGKSDIAWRSTNGTSVAWLMNAAQVAQDGTYAVVPSNWQLVGQRDFNGDGKYDFAWRDANSGTVAIWLLNGLQLLQSGTIGAVPNNWVIAGTSDFNADGKGDLLWRDSNTGTVAVWLMNGLQVTQGNTLGVIPNNWTIAATDGKGEVVWRDSNTGTVAIWVVTNGFQVAQATSLGSVPSNWMIIGVGDFDGNGSTDILWRDANTGTVAVWLMSGLKVLQLGAVGTLPPGGSWSIAETGDFNGDGMTDILWRDNIGSGAGIWFMNGLQVTSTAGTVPVGFDWTIQGLNSD
jgi:hypothetical protein